jgi:hypothetical protein
MRIIRKQGLSLIKLSKIDKQIKVADRVLRKNNQRLIKFLAIIKLFKQFHPQILKQSAAVQTVQAINLKS